MVSTGLRGWRDLVHAFARGWHERLRHHGHSEEGECDQGAKKWPEEATDHEKGVGVRGRSMQAAAGSQQVPLPPVTWIGGHGTDPYEQNTQQ